MSKQSESEPSLEEINESLYKRGLTDGLPVIPPTDERVEEMLRGIDRPRDDVVGRLGNNENPLTVEDLAAEQEGFTAEADRLSAEVESLREGQADLSESVTSIESEQTALGESVEGLSEGQSALEATVDSVEADVEAVAADVDDLDGEANVRGGG